MLKRLGASESHHLDRRMQSDHNHGLEKHPSTTTCPECGLLFQAGAWKRPAVPLPQQQRFKLCPACLQVRDGRAGGVVRLQGNFTDLHRQDLLNRIRNVERLTSEERPLERIISIKEGKGEIEVSATTEHLIARIGKAIQRDFGGSLELHYAPEDKFATAKWRRDD
jgi:hypothetical protein